MKENPVWCPGFHSNVNHLYDLETDHALCGSTARPIKYKISFHGWREIDCPKCIIIADNIHNEERDAEEDEPEPDYPYGWESYETEIRP